MLYTCIHTIYTDKNIYLCFYLCVCLHIQLTKLFLPSINRIKLTTASIDGKLTVSGPDKYMYVYVCMTLMRMSIIEKMRNDRIQIN